MQQDNAALCRLCEGKGRATVSGIMCGSAGCRPGHMDMACPNCEGAGVLTPEREVLLMLAERIRSARNRQDEALRECARRIGIPAMELSDAEHSRLPTARAQEILRMVDPGGGWSLNHRER